MKGHMQCNSNRPASYIWVFSKVMVQHSSEAEYLFDTTGRYPAIAYKESDPPKRESALVYAQKLTSNQSMTRLLKWVWYVNANKRLEVQTYDRFQSHRDSIHSYIFNHQALTPTDVAFQHSFPHFKPNRRESLGAKSAGVGNTEVLWTQFSKVFLLIITSQY